ncbi:FUSC family protein [Teichococcus aestuarii]|uniref:FUSC family protein n=1 Tax=Teichococcus aestuarii TaxID=568898 RepID=UPI00361D6BE4
MPAWPARADWLYSARSFAAAALALLVAFGLDLPRPYWAMATVYIVAQPFAGALRAKALWRLVGTLCGGAFSILVLPNLAGAPPLLLLALALWIGACLAASFYDPTPRAYAFMLSGYTAALICFPIVEQPQAVFDTAVSRMLEIGLGILCAWLMHGVLFPRRGVPRLLAASRAGSPTSPASARTASPGSMIRNASPPSAAASRATARRWSCCSSRPATRRRAAARRSSGRRTCASAPAPCRR